jgi:hypothetical protein
MSAQMPKKRFQNHLPRRRGQAPFAPKTTQMEPVPDGFETASKALWPSTQFATGRASR